MLKKCDRGASKHLLISWRVTNINLKVNGSRLCGSFKMSQMQVDVREALGSKWSSVFLRKTGHVTTISLKKRKTVNFEWYRTICLSKVFKKIRKTNCQRSHSPFDKLNKAIKKHKRNYVCLTLFSCTKTQGMQKKFDLFRTLKLEYRP